MKRKTIGENPLDVLVPPREEAKAKPRRRSAAAPEPETKKRSKERLTVHLPVDVIDRAKNAVYWSPGLTLAGFAEEAFVSALVKLEKERGKPFDSRKAELKGGRPIK